MSMTKNQFHDEINELSLEARNSIYEATGGHFDAYPMAIMAAEQNLIDEREIDWFPDFKLSHDGYQEFICDLCNQPCETRFGHKECHDREQFWSDQRDEEEPF